MFTKHLTILSAAGLGLALLSGPAIADWGPAQQRLSGKAKPAVAATAETTQLAQKLRDRGATRRSGPTIQQKKHLSTLSHEPDLRAGGQNEIVMTDHPGRETPSRPRTGSAQAQTNDIAVETLTLQHEGID